MRENQWIKWTKTRLEPGERDQLLAALTSKQKTQLLEQDYVRVERVGVLWNPPNGAPLRRARFTHGFHFQTDRGDLYIDSEGIARLIPRRADAQSGRERETAPSSAASSPKTCVGNISFPTGSR